MLRGAVIKDEVFGNASDLWPGTPVLEESGQERGTSMSDCDTVGVLSCRSIDTKLDALAASGVCVQRPVRSVLSKGQQILRGSMGKQGSAREGCVGGTRQPPAARPVVIWADSTSY